ncbi:MAG TPA: hypothetical protein VL403_00205 [Candidatus Kryptonia bacterium]|nr:hypothetical protein [Candidatus Kryptonia bacterium]
MAVETHLKDVEEPTVGVGRSDQTSGDFEAIFANWPYLAAVAWRGYDNSGCGAVVVSVAEGCADVAYASGSLPSSYAHLVAAYDPLEEVVIVVRHSESEQAYRLSGRPTPRECAEQAVTYTTSANLYCVPQDCWPQ